MGGLGTWDQLSVTGSRHRREEVMLPWSYGPSLSSALESLLITIRPGRKLMMSAQKLESQKGREESFLEKKIKVLTPEDTDTFILLRLMWADGGHVSIRHTINFKTAS